MAKDVKKYCYNCGKDIESVYKEGGFCPNCHHPVKAKDDKLGFFTYAEDYIKGKAKSKAFSKTYNYAKNFFLSKLASYILVVTISLTSVSTVNNVITTAKNKQYIEEPESVEEASDIFYFDMPTEIYEDNIQMQINSDIETPIMQEDIQFNEEENIDVIEEENIAIVEEENIDVVEEQIEYYEENYDYSVDDDQWNNFMNNFGDYCRNQDYDPTIFENGEVYGPVAAAFAKADDSIDIGTAIVNDGNHIYAYYFYDDGDWTSNDGDVIFGRLELIDKGYTFSIVSDESSSATFEEIYQ